MTNRLKTMLRLFADYFMCILYQLLGLVLLSWAFRFFWADPVYSILFSLLLFCRVYTRTNKAAKRDLRNHDKTPLVFDGALMVMPLVLVHLLILLSYYLICENIIPLRDVWVNTVYSFPDDAPRAAREIFLPEALVPYLRIWFGSVMGFMGDGFSVSLALLVPLSHLLAGFFGYFAGLKKFYILDFLWACWGKVKEKFNE